KLPVRSIFCEDIRMTKGENIRKVTLLKKTTTFNEYNEPVESWDADAGQFEDGKLYVEWWDQGGKEALESGQIVAIKDIRIKPVEWIRNINEADYRIEKEGRQYDIQSIKEMGRSKQIIMLKAGDNA